MNLIKFVIVIVILILKINTLLATNSQRNDLIQMESMVKKFSSDEWIKSETKILDVEEYFCIKSR